MADPARELPLIRYTVALVLLIVALGVLVLAAIIYQNHRYNELSERANAYHLRAANQASDALGYLALIENLLLTGPANSYPVVRDLSSYRQLFAERVEQLLALEAARNAGAVPEHLRQQWQAFRIETMGLEQSESQAMRAFDRGRPALELTLRQLQRQHDIAHQELSAELASHQRAGTRNIGVLLIATLIIGAAFGWRTLRLMHRSVEQRLAAQRALKASRDDLEQTVAARTAELQATVAELEAFSYSVSHDLRAPLRAIDGFSRILELDHAGQLDAEGRDCLRRIRNGAQRMGELIDDLLELSRVGRSELRPTDVDLSALAREIVAQLETADPGRRVAVDIAPALKARGDAHLLQIALTNLLDNAWKYTRKSEAARIEFGATSRNGHTTYVVRDNGAGFDMAYAGKLFSPFQRLHRTGEFEGIGIGLAIVARVVSRHGGRVWAQGEPGKGASFFFTLGT